MKDYQSILEAYRAADDEKRLYLFLAHRPLRSRFVQIEHERYAVRLQETSASDKKKRSEKRSLWRSLRAGFALGKS